MKRFEHGGNIHRLRAQRGTSGLDTKILDFSANINCLGPSQRVREAFEASFDDMGAYPDPHYTRFIETMAGHFGVQAEHIFPGNGAAELLHMAVAALEPKIALVVGPTFVEYERALEAYHCSVRFFMTRDSDDFRPSMEDLMAEVQGLRPDLVILCNPNNPTGVFLEREAVLKLLSCCEASGAHLLMDEAFMDFAGERASVMNSLVEHEQLMILRSLTKFYAIPAIRAGFMATASPIFRRHYEAKAIPWSVNQTAQDMAVAAVTDRAFEAATLEYYGAEALRLQEALANLPGVTAFKPAANYVFFRYDGKEPLESKLKEQGILIRSCRNYPGLDERYYRVAVKGQEDNVCLITKLREIL